MKQVHRRFLSLVITLVGFLAIAQWVGQEQEELKVEAENVSKDAKIFSTLSPLEVDRIELRNQHGRFTLVRERRGQDEVGRWLVEAPHAFQADVIVVEGVLAQALPMRRRLTVPNPEKLPLAERLKSYGLAEPREVVTLTSGEKVETVRFGMSNAFDKSLYAYLEASQEIVTVPDSLRHQLGKSLFDLRNKQLIEFEPARINGLVIKYGERLLRFEKDGGRWSLSDGTSVLPVALDRMEDLVQDLRALKFNRIIDEDAMSSAAKGLLERGWTFQLTGEGETDLSLKLALREVDDIETLFGANAQGGPVGELVRGRWPSLLKGGFQGLIERRVLPFDLGAARSIELRDGSKTSRFERSDEGAWKVVAPAERALNLSRLKGLFHTVNSLEQVRVISEEISLEQASAARAISTSRSLLVEFQGEEFTLHPQSGEEPNEVWTNQRVLQVDANRLADILWQPSDYLTDVEDGN